MVDNLSHLPFKMLLNTQNSILNISITRYQSMKLAYVFDVVVNRFSFRIDQAVIYTHSNYPRWLLFWIDLDMLLSGFMHIIADILRFFYYMHLGATKLHLSSAIHKWNKMNPKLTLLMNMERDIRLNIEKYSSSKAQVN